MKFLKIEKEVHEKKEKSQAKSEGGKVTYKKLFWGAISVLLLFLCLICPILNWLNGFADKEVGKWFVIKEGVTDWLAFWGSFSGTIATVLVGIVTMKLTEQIEEDDRKDAELKKQMSIATNMPNMKCKSVKIYSFNKGDISLECLTHFEKNNSYCMHFELSPAFPPYFEIRIIEYELEILKKEHSITIEKLEQGKDYSFTNHKDFKLYINVDVRAEPWVEHFYDLRLETTNATSFTRKNVKVRLRFECNNALLPGNEGKVIFDMILMLESQGKINDCVKLKANNIQLANGL